MMVRLRDFAEIHRITERTVQIHIKNNEEALEGHIDRRGKQGTWLDEFAVDFLLDRIQLPTKDEVVMPTPREAALLMEVAEANRKWADAEQRASRNLEAAGKALLLEETTKAQEAQIRDLSMELGRMTQMVETIAQKASEDARKAVEAEKDKEIAQIQQKATDERTAAQKAFDEDLSKKDGRIQELVAYAAAQKARADFFALPWFKRIGKTAPIVPELQEDEK